MTDGKLAYVIAGSFMLEGHGALHDYAHAWHPLIEAAGGDVLVAGHAGQDSATLIAPPPARAP